MQLELSSLIEELANLPSLYTLLIVPVLSSHNYAKLRFFPEDLKMEVAKNSSCHEIWVFPDSSRTLTGGK